MPPFTKYRKFTVAIEWLLSGYCVAIEWLLSGYCIIAVRSAKIRICADARMQIYTDTHALMNEFPVVYLLRNPFTLHLISNDFNGL